MMPKHHRDLGLKVSTSNLCSEITLPTGRDHLGKDRTAVCCLSSLNLETWDEWNGDKVFIEDVMRMLDNVLQDYIDRAPPEMARAKYSASRERSVGLGVMGFHSFLQARGLPFEGEIVEPARSSSISARRSIRRRCCWPRNAAPVPTPRISVMERFSCKMAIAPTASISIICGGTSACIEPIPANIYTHKTAFGQLRSATRILEALLVDKAKNSDAMELDPRTRRQCPAPRLPDAGREATATRPASIDQRWLLELAADRTPYRSGGR
jgi:ribonucleoside-diphosphate reductase alpha chain